METLEQTLEDTHTWVVDRLYTLYDTETDDLLSVIEDAHALQAEFSEWLNPNTKDHEIVSLEYIGD